MREVEEQIVQQNQEDEIYLYPDETGDEYSTEYDFPKIEEGQIPVNMYHNMMGAFAKLSDEFNSYKGYQNLVLQFSVFNQFQENEKKIKKTVVFDPDLQAKSEKINYIDSESMIAQDILENHQGMIKILDDMEQAYPEDKYPVHNRILQYEKKHAQFINDPDAAELLAGCPEYNLSFQKTMFNLPGAKFKDPNNAAKYAENIDKWNEFHKNHVFIDQAEENQDFFLNHYVPFAKKMKAGTLTAKDTAEYNVAYAEHMLKQKQYFEEIKNYDLDGDDFDDSYLREKKDRKEFERVWKGAGFTDRMLDETNTAFKLLDKGWPAADMVFLKELKNAMTRLSLIAENSEKNYTPEEVSKAEEILKSMKPAYNDIMNKEVTSPEERADKLAAIENSVKEYAKLNQDYNNRIYGNEHTDVAEPSIIRLLNEARGRKVYTVEVGKDKGQLEAAKSTVFNSLTSSASELFDSVLLNNPDDPDKRLYNDFISADTPVYENALSGLGENSRKLALPILTAINLNTIINEDKYNELLAEVKKMVDKSHKVVQQYGDDEVAQQLEEFADSRYNAPLRRILKGCSDNYLSARTPFGQGISIIGSQLPISNDNNRMRNAYIKWENKFPVHRLNTECQRQMDMFADYYMEREANNGELPPEREEYYRQMIYDQTVAISSLYDKVMTTLEDPVSYEGIKKDKVLQDDPYCIHPIASRGTKTLKCSIEGYKIALENGWTLDDAALISAFYHTLYEEEVRAGYSSSTTRDKIQKYDKPQYSSPEKQEFIERMRAFYEDLKTHPLKSPADRDRYMKNMNALMKEGVEKEYLKVLDSGRMRNRPIVDYYKQLQIRGFEKNINIGLGKTVAMHTKPLEKGTNREISAVIADFTTKRTDMWLSSESSVHENLRKSCEKLQNYMKEHPDKGMNAEKGDKLSEYASEYLDILDEIKYNADIYMDSRKGASSDGGKARLKGAGKISSFVEIERDTVLRDYNKKAGKDFQNVEQLRVFLAAEKKIKAYNEISQMQAMPTDEAGKKKLASLAADILVSKFSAVAGNGSKTFHGMGAGLMKKEILKNSDFKNLMKSFYNDRNMTPAILATEISDSNLIDRLNANNKTLKNINDKVVANENRKKADRDRNSNLGPKPKA